MKDITVIDIAKKLEPDQKIEIRNRIKRTGEQIFLFYGDANDIVEHLAHTDLADNAVYRIKIYPDDTLCIVVDQRRHD